MPVGRNTIIYREAFVLDQTALSDFSAIPRRQYDLYFAAGFPERRLMAGTGTARPMFFEVNKGRA
ncbi:hypothetical protein [Mesorhizobium sp. M1322]|uniref:hypothetical protein n=1 Tax=Mesorhizobium sp. M1322 TaxID=2957081 RepID=UPI00333BF7BB